MASATETSPLLSFKQEPYSIFTPRQKRLIILTAAIASSFSPLSANIYYPALNALAAGLDVSSAQINLTITTYMITQALSPTFTTSFADTSGRRPAYLLCFTIYITANILLAVQNSYPALLILRALQSTGISGTVALASAVAADTITPDERGLYMGFTSLGNVLAPSLGPVLGGVMCEYTGWRGVFWFLALSAGIVGVGMGMWFPETCRRVVGDGSGSCTSSSPASGDSEKKRTTYNPFSPLCILFHLPAALLLLSNALVFASYYTVMAGIPSLFKEIYGLSELGIGLAFIPAGLGSLASAMFNGVLVDWNYRRVRRGFERNCGRGESDFDGEENLKTEVEAETGEEMVFPVERARLQIGGPMTFLCTIPLLLYALLLPQTPPLPVSLVLIFLISFTITASYNVINVLLVDLYYSTPASAMATNNLVRCLFGAASTALVQPCIRRFGVGTTYAVVAGVVGMICCPLLGTVYIFGAGWRGEREKRRERKGMEDGSQGTRKRAE
ncbi:major facilitator superfamily domain-containing protein [Aspergillus carlsbadensis]|nr:major facilitator superfamily domain-containing protein [Aspergillus carlsbadensis]